MNMVKLAVFVYLFLFGILDPVWGNDQLYMCTYIRVAQINQTKAAYFL